ncbi:MAG: rRNA maturation RNase YbeY [Planctomycetaceae bacterium]|nr:rRNA maturation RNase YbeY [Planctomycetaceae bacterium]
MTGDLEGDYFVEIADQQGILSIDEDWLRRVVEQTLKEERVVIAEIVVALVNDARIHEVNREHLEHDYPTDVISFVYESSRVKEPASELRGDGLSLDGELVISTETAVREASIYGWEPEDELTLYVVHGLLHLCGYDDLSPEERQLMRTREQLILKNWNLLPHYKD